MRTHFAITALICLALTVAAHAQPNRMPSSLSDDQVRRVLVLALDNISRARCDNSPCAPATAEEKANPPLTLAEARAIMQRGVLSAAAQYCGLDWGKQNFEPMMAHWRRDLKKNERQMALIGLVHGVMQGMTKFDSQAACSAEMRDNIGRQLAFRPERGT